MATSVSFGRETCETRTLLSSISRRSHHVPTTRARRGPRGRPSGTRGLSPEGSDAACSKGKAAACLGGPTPRAAARRPSRAARSRA
eukprot:11214342-Lingulodinium_polyedra.AAC.1